MAAPRLSIEQKIDQLAALRTVEHLEDAHLQQLREGLASRQNLVAAKAAQVIGQKQLASFEPDLIAAFDRFMAGSDRGCIAKQQIAQALLDIGARAVEILRRGARHVQKEPSFGGSGDAAAELRGICALGLVRCGDPLALEVLVELLVDPQMQVRVMAARALGCTGYEPSAMLLRLKALVGDAEEDVTAECLMQLMQLSPGESLSFVEKFMDRPEASVRQAAALAIASWRDGAALKCLTDRWAADTSSEVRRELALAIATHRSEPAIDFLLARLAEDGLPTAVGVLEALALHRGDEAVWGRVGQVVAERDEETLSRMYRRA